MKRRRFLIGTLVAVLPSTPSRAELQRPGKAARIGVLSQLTAAELGSYMRAFREGLLERGYVESENIAVDWRFAGSNVKRFPELAAGLVRMNVDVLVATVNHAIRAAQAVTKTIPIVMVVPSDPVGLGFVSSLSRPGGNTTGLTWLTRETVPKRLQLLKETIPNLSTVGVVWDGNEPARRGQVEEAQRAAPSVGVKLNIVEVRTSQELDGAFTRLAQAGAQAVLVEASSMIASEVPRIAALATQNRLGTIGWHRGMAEAGCLMSYSPNLREQYRRAAYFVAKILKGANPAELPVEQPTTFELAINLKTAKSLGISIPQSLLLRADEVIQ